jgi:hypothetical protein
VRRSVVLLPLLVLVLPACADPVIDPSTDARDAVIRVSQGPGMGTVGSAFTEPELIVAGDGTVYRHLYGEPVATFHVDHGTVVRWLTTADQKGLLDDEIVSQTAEGLMDAGSTSVVLDTGRVHLRHSVYGLGDRSGFDGMREFVEEIEAWADDQAATTYVPTAYRVLGQDAAGDYVCTVSAVRPAISDSVLAFADLLPGDDCGSPEDS